MKEKVKLLKKYINDSATEEFKNVIVTRVTKIDSSKPLVFKHINVHRKERTFFGTQKTISSWKSKGG